MAKGNRQIFAPPQLCHQSCLEQVWWFSFADAVVPVACSCFKFAQYIPVPSLRNKNHPFTVVRKKVVLEKRNSAVLQKA